MALTYSWSGGKAEMRRLKGDDRERSLQGEIEYSQLAPTHQHAIQVALGLDYEYIWVDALGIDQDNWSDWEEQSMRVPDIYGNVHIVIVAGRSEDSRHGFLTMTYSPEVPAVQFPYKGSHSPGSSNY